MKGQNDGQLEEHGIVDLRGAKKVENRRENKKVGCTELRRKRIINGTVVYEF